MIGNPVLTATKWSREHIRRPYDGDETCVIYKWDNGCLKQPVAGVAGTPAVSIRLSSPHGEKMVCFDYGRYGDKPVLPAREPDVPNVQTFRAMVIFSYGVKLVDGRNPFYRAVGWYEYDLLVPPSEASGYVIPQGPTIDPGSGFARTVTANDFSTAILGTQPAPPVVSRVQ